MPLSESIFQRQRKQRRKPRHQKPPTCAVLGDIRQGHLAHIFVRRGRHEARLGYVRHLDITSCVTEQRREWTSGSTLAPRANNNGEIIYTWHSVAPTAAANTTARHGTPRARTCDNN